MTMTALRTLPNIIASMHRFLNDVTYTVGAETKTIRDYFPGLLIMPAYPDDLVQLKSPVLALGELELATPAPDLMGSPGYQTKYRLPLYGFVCGRGSDAKNKMYRDKLMSDLVELFNIQGSNEGLLLYDAESKQVIGEIEITQVSARILPKTAPTVEADRYKFLVECDLEYSQ